MKYRKKPVVIEAVQFFDEPDTICELDEFMNQTVISYEQGRAMLRIDTLEGTMIAYEGDWIIKGVNGEFYPCKSDIFDKTYEAAE